MRSCLRLAVLGFSLAVTTTAAEADVQIYRVHGIDQEAALELLRAGFDLVSGSPGKFVDIVADDSRRAELEGYGTSIETKPLSRQIPPGYTDYAGVTNLLAAIANVYPSIAMRVDIGDGWGESYGGSYPDHEQWAIKISDNVAVDEDEPVVLYTGTTHAREIMTVEICLGILDHLVNNYGSDPDITNYIDNTEIWIVPLVNADGHYCVTDLSYDFWRKNVRDNDSNSQITGPGFNYPDGVDLNRNFGWQFGGQGSSSSQGEQNYRGPSAFSEPESQGIRDFSLAVNPLIAVDYHSYGEFILFPFGYDQTTQAPDHALLEEIAGEMASRIDRLGNGTYDYFIAHDLYPAAGNSIDWRYGEMNTFAYTPETGTSFNPSSSTMNIVVDDNIPGAIYMLERTFDGPGLRGTVTQNGAPVDAEVKIDNVDVPSLANPRRTEPGNGDYHRLLAQGNYSVTITVDGVGSQSFKNVSVGATGWTVLDANFETVSVPTAGDVAVGIRAFPNPMVRRTDFNFVRAGGESATIDIFDASGRLVRALSIGDARSGQVRWDGRDTAGIRVPSGVYFARMTDEGQVETTTIQVVR